MTLFLNSKKVYIVLDYNKQNLTKDHLSMRTNNPYLTPDKTSIHYDRKYTNQLSTTPPTVEPKQTTERPRIFRNNPVKVSFDYSERNSNSPYRKQVIYTHEGNRQVSPQRKTIDVHPLSSQSIHHVIPQREEYFRMSETELKNILLGYELEIVFLKDYIHEKQITLQKNIRDTERNYHNILSQQRSCDCQITGEANKVALKQLSSKVSGLIKENSRLRSKEKSIIVKTRPNQEDLQLLNENKKLRTIISEYQNNQKVGKQKLVGEIHGLRRQIGRLETENQKIRNSQVKIQPRIEQQYSRDDIDFVKSHLTKTMYEFSQKIEQKNVNISQRMNAQQKKIDYLERALREYKKQRQIRIQSTVRKSYIMSQSLKKPAGDQDLGISDIPEFLEESYMQPKINLALSHKPQRVQGSQRFEDPNIKLREDKINNLIMKNNNLIEENKSLSNQLQTNQARTKQKIAHILILERQMAQMRNSMNISVSKVSKQEQPVQIIERPVQIIERPPQIIEREIYDPEIYGQIKLIRQLLQSCNITNYELFFKELNQIIEQRDQMQNQMKYFQGISGKLNLKRSKEQTDILNSKISELTSENTKLIKKVADLEVEVDRYQSDILNQEINNLSSLNLKDHPNLPTGKQALQWQKIVKSCIQNSVARLSFIQNRIQNKRVISNSKVPIRHSVTVKGGN